MGIEVLESRIAPAAITITNLHESTLIAAITQANTAGGTNTITFGPHLHGTINLATPLPAILNNLTITAPTTAKVAISGLNKNQIFDIGYNASTQTSATVNVTISGLTLKDGKTTGSHSPTKEASGGAVYINDYGGTVTIQNCTISGNHATGANGVLANASGGYMGRGGGIAVLAGSLTVTQSKITGNVATGGSGPSGYTAGGAAGGGIYVYGGATLTVQNSTITGNTAMGGVGVAGAKGGKGPKVPVGTAGYSGYNGGYGGNGGNAYGGGIFNGGTTTILSSTITGNKAIGGNGGNGGKGGAGGQGGAGNAHYPAGIGGTGGTGGNGGNGGNAAGGGVASYAANNATLTVTSSTVTGNTVTAGLGGKAGAGGAAGAGRVYTYNGTTYRGEPGAKGYAGANGTASDPNISYLGSMNPAVVFAKSALSSEHTVISHSAQQSTNTETLLQAIASDSFTFPTNSVHASVENAGLTNTLFTTGAPLPGLETVAASIAAGTG